MALVRDRFYMEKEDISEEWNHRRTAIAIKEKKVDFWETEDEEKGENRKAKVKCR